MAARFLALLPVKFQPYAKAVYPFVANLVFIAATLISTGDYDRADLKVNALGLVGTLLTLLVPNRRTV